jgi:Fic family protein
MLETDFEKTFPGELVPTALGCKAFVPDRLPPCFGPEREIGQLHDQALLRLGELRAVVPSLPNPALISRPFLRREAVLSSKIEGTHTEIEGLYLFETTKDDKRANSDRTEASKDAQEVSNYVDALNYGLEQLASMPVCNRLLKEMHALLLANVQRDRGQYKSPGEFRASQAYIGSSDIHAARYGPSHKKCPIGIDAKWA